MTGQFDPQEDRIDILLATYNGERFLAEQLDSLIAQTHTNWRLLARDDGSGDATKDLLNTYKEKLAGKMVVLDDGDANLGIVGNFSALMVASTAPYIAFCDQDDVWRPEKLALGLAAVQELEARCGTGMPCLSFSDLEVVDAQLKAIASSFWKSQNVSPARAGELSRALAQNVITGCTAVMNRNLVDLASPIPDGALFHDWWVAIIAAAFGRVAPVPQATMQYRQHEDNETGRKGYNLKANLARIIEFIRTTGRSQHRYRRRYDQAVAFHAKFGRQLDPASRGVVERFIEMPRVNIMKRAFVLTARSYLPTGFLRIVSFIVYFNKKIVET